MVEPLPFLPVLAALAGLLFGSFLNVCIYRIPRDLSVVAPRSFCPQCGAAIAWHSNIPVLSFVLLRGRCFHCESPIPWRYPAVEILAAALWGTVAWRYGLTAAAGKWLLFESLLLFLFWTDIEERLLPDEGTLGGTAAGLVLSPFVHVHSAIVDLLLNDWAPWLRSLANALVGGLILAVPLWLFGRLYSRLRKREGLGFGDVKLLLLLGVFLGFDAGLFSLLVSTVAGSLLGIAYVVWTRKEMRTYELPFGSFLCAGAAFLPLFSNLSSV